MLPNIDDLIKLGVHDWTEISGRFTDMYGKPGKCALCGETMSRLEDDRGREYASVYCDNYQCPRSWKFAAYLMGKWWPVDRVYATMEDFASTVKDAVDSVDTSWPDYNDPGTLM